ncbi:MAG: DUF58 domain-containing protein [Calditrichaeota bacterium]|nr:MAG: DUF58 domain-containing protein [Calditrichota bacterium]MBL1203802.1 DUF58 domain-containing protein [Calditrichota bacterium]NOG43632.1 DUF58 domain-containing protein [Calditrichota bacterium]
MTVLIISLISFAVVAVAVAIFFFLKSPAPNALGQEQLSPEAKTREILKKVKQIEVSTRSVVNEVFSGEYHSVFKGRGMEFAEVREYQPGDDVRTIDWNVSARSGHPFVKVFEEERELTVMLLVDVSSSGNFGTAEQFKREIAAELSAVLAFSAIKNNDKVGLMIFSDKIEKFIPPRKGKKHVLRVIREILFYKPQDSSTDLNVALEYLSRIIKRKSTVFLISDFLTENFEKSLHVANRKHDIIAISITDPREVTLPNVGLIELQDAETGESVTVDAGDANIRNAFYQTASHQRQELTGLFRSIGVDHIDVLTDRSYIEPITRFFKMRERRLSA